MLHSLKRAMIGRAGSSQGASGHPAFTPPSSFREGRAEPAQRPATCKGASQCELPKAQPGPGPLLCPHALWDSSGQEPGAHLWSVACTGLMLCGPSGMEPENTLSGGCLQERRGAAQRKRQEPGQVEPGLLGWPPCQAGHGPTTQCPCRNQFAGLPC